MAPIVIITIVIILEVLNIDTVSYLSISLLGNCSDPLLTGFVGFLLIEH